MNQKYVQNHFFNKSFSRICKIIIIPGVNEKTRSPDLVLNGKLCKAENLVCASKDELQKIWKKLLNSWCQSTRSI
jgi:hypothetical protein